jgi:hypothetical protein
MAVSKNEIQVKWSASDTVSVTFGSNATSDEITLSGTAASWMVQVKADNAGTPASGDELKVFILLSTGDPDADPDSADEFDTVGHAQHVMTLDTNTEDPAILTRWPLPPAKKAKVYVENDASSNSITVSAQVYEIRA